MNLTPVIVTGIVVGIPATSILVGMRMTHQHDERLAEIKRDSAQPTDRIRR